MSVRYVVPEEMKERYVPARNMHDEWYLVPMELITKTDNDITYICYPYFKSGHIDWENPVDLKRTSFDL